MSEDNSFPSSRMISEEDNYDDYDEDEHNDHVIDDINNILDQNDKDMLLDVEEGDKSVMSEVVHE